MSNLYHFSIITLIGVLYITAFVKLNALVIPVDVEQFFSNSSLEELVQILDDSQEAVSLLESVDISGPINVMTDLSFTASFPVTENKTIVQPVYFVTSQQAQNASSYNYEANISMYPVYAMAGGADCGTSECFFQVWVNAESDELTAALAEEKIASTEAEKALIAAREGNASALSTALAAEKKVAHYAELNYESASGILTNLFESMGNSPYVTIQQKNKWHSYRKLLNVIAANLRRDSRNAREAANESAILPEKINTLNVQVTQPTVNPY
jgi:hypothetical protein